MRRFYLIFLPCRYYLQFHDSMPQYFYFAILSVCFILHILYGPRARSLKFCRDSGFGLNYEKLKLETPHEFRHSLSLNLHRC
jgi:hypothetical protein